MLQKISIEKALQLPNSLFIDTRSPKEYEIDHIQGAINLPLLNDEEHHIVGFTYKQISKDQAIEKGMEYYAKKIPSIIKTIQDHKEKNLLIYCARGGMRSKIIASLLDSIGFTVYQVEKGYKAFRNYMVEKITNYKINPQVVIIYGLTGTGKTEILQKIPNSIDLEGLAEHRGSLMGALGKKPNSQKKFENLLLKRLDQLENQKFIFIEGESRRVGDAIIPPFLWKAMCTATKIKVNRSLDNRAKAMVDEYFLPKHIEEIKMIVSGFRRVISNKNKETIINYIEQKDYFTASKMIFEFYYDPLYAHTLNAIEFEFEINADDIDTAVKDLHKNFQTIL
jgi:tRNA 2-selenouridine synthase